MQLQEFLDTPSDARFTVNARDRDFIEAFPIKPGFTYFSLSYEWVHVTFNRPSLIEREGKARSYYEFSGEARRIDTGETVAIAGLSVLMALTRVGTNRTHVELWTEKPVLKRYLFSVLEDVAFMWPESGLTEWLEGEGSEDAEGEKEIDNSIPENLTELAEIRRIEKLANQYGVRPSSIQIWEKIARLKRAGRSNTGIQDYLGLPKSTFDYHWGKMRKKGFWRE